MKLKFRPHFLLLTCLTIFSSCNGQEKGIINEENVLQIGEDVKELDDKIWAVYLDDKGNYWFGSNGKGVYLYDGEILKLITTEDGLIDNTIREIKGDHLGNVFIGTPEGVSMYDGTRFTTLKPITSAPNKWMSEPNDLWFNCNGNHLYRYDGENLYELQLPRQDLKKAFGVEVLGVGFKDMNNSPYAVYGIDRDRSGNMWFGTVTAGVFRYDGESFLWIAEKELSVLPDGRVPGVRSMIEDKNGDMWLSNFISKYRITETHSVCKYEKITGIDKSNELLQNKLPYFNSGLSDSKGDLWMTTYGGGVWMYDGETLINFPVKKGDDEVLLISIYKDNSGVLWLGTDNDGVYKFNGESFEKFLPLNH